MDKQLIDRGSHAIAILSRKLEIQAVNSAFCSILCYSDHELRNVVVDKIIHPDDFDEFKSVIEGIFSGQTTFAELQQRCVTKSGNDIQVHLTLDRFTSFRDADENPQITMNVRNLSQEIIPTEEYEQIQWFLQKTFETIDQGVAIFDRDFRLVACNKRYESFEIFPQEYLQRGTYLVDAYKAIAQSGVFGPGDPEQQAKEHIESLINRKVKLIEELKSQNERRIEIRRYLMPEGGLIAVFTDITEQRNAEVQLRQSQKMEAVGQLTGGIAHDFNNILNIILGSLYLLEREIPDDKAREHINTMKRTGQRAADLTRQLLAFSRSEATSKKTIDINGMIDNLRNLIIHSLTPQVELDYQFTKDLWLTEIDPGDFEDALLNLTLNARDAMSGRGRLTLETSNCMLDASYCSLNPGVSPGEYVQLAVSDTGKGISRNQQDRIFEPFFTTKEKDKGTGLGLAMVFGFVKRSRGYIKLYSEPGIGTTFRIYLPRFDGQDDLSGEMHTQSQQLPKGTETLLIVDDEIDLANIARESLQALGYKVLTASNGTEALELMNEGSSIDLLFSDVVMPGGINGFELAEIAITLLPNLKILLTSGYTERAVAHNGQARFKTNLLDKPYTQYELAQRVRNLLDDQVLGDTVLDLPK